MTRVLMVSVLLCGLAVSAGAEDRSNADGRGWIFGGGITSGTIAFAGAEDLAVAVGPVDRVEVPLLGPAIAERRIEVIDASAPPPPETVHVAPFPQSTTGAANRFGACREVHISVPGRDGPRSRWSAEAALSFTRSRRSRRADDRYGRLRG